MRMINSAIPREEYPRPQFARSTWMNLNGVWQFEMDLGASGRARGLIEKEKLEREILVPFCPESALSGVNYKDFMAAVWYRRTFDLPPGSGGQARAAAFWGGGLPLRSLGERPERGRA